MGRLGDWRWRQPAGEQQLEYRVKHGWQQSLKSWINSASVGTMFLSWLLIATLWQGPIYDAMHQSADARS